MNLRKLPPSMLLALGLTGCGDEPDMGVCLSVTGPATNTTNDSATSTTATSTTGESEEVGPCLDVGPCLFDVPPLPETSTSGTDTGTGDDTGTDTGSGTDTGGSGSSSGGMFGPESDREEALQRMIDRGALPPDVAERLRRRGD